MSPPNALERNHKANRGITPRPLDEGPTQGAFDALVLVAAVRQLVDAAFHKATQTLGTHRAALAAGAQELLERETLTATDIERLLNANVSARQ